MGCWCCCSVSAAGSAPRTESSGRACTLCGACSEVGSIGASIGFSAEGAVDQRGEGLAVLERAHVVQDLESDRALAIEEHHGVGIGGDDAFERARLAHQVGEVELAAGIACDPAHGLGE